MDFEIAWHRQPSSHLYAYLLTDQGVIPETGPWFGLVLTSAVKLARKEHDAPWQLADFFAMAENPLLYATLSFVNFDDGVASGDRASFEKALLAHPWGKGSKAALMWIPRTATFEVAARLPMSPKVDRRGRKSHMLLDSPQKAPLLLLDGGDFAALVPTGNISIVVSPNTTGDGIKLASKRSIALAMGQKQADPNASIVTGKTSGWLMIPLSGAQAGCITGDGQVGEAAGQLGPRIRYEVTVPGTPAQTTPDTISGAINYPILDASDGLAGRAAGFTVNPNAPTDAARSCITLSDTTPFATAFRTRSADVISLAPQAGSAVSFNSNGGGELYLTLSGPFETSVPGTPTSFDLLCGLSGVEYLSLVPGDALAFHPNQQAGILYAPGQGLSGADVKVFTTDTRSSAGTAYVSLQPTSKTPERAYFAEPDSSPFFANLSGGAQPSQLEYLAVARTSLSGAAGPDPQPFPIAPYAQVPQAKSGPGQDPQIVRSIELQYLNPNRLVAIEATGTPAAAATETSVRQALTPQGHLATFTNGQWTGLQVAQMKGKETNVDLSFTSEAGRALPEPLQQAFLTNQQFLVISEDTDNLGANFKPQIVMDGWTFDLDLSVNKSVGAYRNVIIFKSADATLAQLAATPELWTARSAFTSDQDPDGTYISNWLVSYIASAREMFDEGHGVAALAQFIEIVDDPDWNGFLILNLNIKSDPGALAPEIEALLAGIDKSLFVAHHVGNLTNHITETDTGFDLNSAVFGLVHYTDPGFQPNAPDVSYIATPNDYDFLVLTLEAIFEGAALTHFSNKSRLTANLLFGDTVSPVAPEGQVPRNSLVILGTYKSVGGVPVYTFATPPGTQGAFFVSSNALSTVTITKATMSVQSGADGSYIARFGFWGSLAFQQQEGFDLLSFERLAFQNLAIDMALTPSSQGGANAFERSFTFSTGAMALERAGLKKLPIGTPPPPGSDDNVIRDTGWLASFPLKVRGLVTGGSGDMPADQGYWPLTTVAPKQIGSADLSGKPWYALSFDMTLGTKGALASKAVIGADVLLAWTPGGDGDGVSIAPMIKLVGPEGMALSFDIEGVVKFGARDVVLNKIKRSAGSTEPDMFVMIFESIALRVLMLSFPPAGTTNVYLLGGLDDTEGSVGTDEVNPTLGWVGGYQAKEPS